MVLEEKMISEIKLQENAVLGDKQLQADLKAINPNFGDFVKFV